MNMQRQESLFGLCFREENSVPGRNGAVEIFFSLYAFHFAVSLWASIGMCLLPSLYISFIFCILFGTDAHISWRKNTGSVTSITFTLIRRRWISGFQLVSFLFIKSCLIFVSYYSSGILRRSLLRILPQLQVFFIWTFGLLQASCYGNTDYGLETEKV